MKGHLVQLGGQKMLWAVVASRSATLNPIPAFLFPISVVGSLGLKIRRNRHTKYLWKAVGEKTMMSSPHVKPLVLGSNLEVSDAVLAAD